MGSNFRQRGYASLRGGVWLGVGFLFLAILFLLQDSTSEEDVSSGEPVPNLAVGEDDSGSAPEYLEAGPQPLRGTGPLIVEMRWLGAFGAATEEREGTATLLGHVVDELGNPLPGAALRILGGPQDGKTTLSSRNGAYRFPGLVPGSQFLEIKVPGRLPVVRIQRAGALRPFSRDFVVGGPVAIDVTILDHEGKPLGGAKVETDLGTQTAFTDDEGWARLARVPASPRTPLDIRAKGHVPIRYELDLVGPAQGGLIKVALPALTKSSSIQGRVKSWPGGNLPRVTVVPRARKPGPIQPIWETWQGVEVDSSGRFLLEGLPFQVVDVRVFHASGVADPRVRTVRPSPEFPTTVDFVIRPGKGRVHGKVLDGAGKPLGGILLSLEAQNPAAVLARLYPGLEQTPGLVRLPVPAAIRRTMVTKKSGAFDFAVGDHPKGSGQLLLKAEGPGWAPLRQPVKAAQDGLSLRMRPESRNGAISLEARSGVQIPPSDWYLDGEVMASQAGLQEGTYAIVVFRGEELLFSREAFEIRGETRLKIDR
jgi:hypothetical protein